MNTASTQGLAEDRRAVSVLSIATVVGLAIHAAWIPLFVSLDVAFLAAFNAAAMPLYLVALLMVRRYRFSFWGWSLCGEVIVNTSFATAFVGWDAGFHYFNFIVAFGAFVVPKLRDWERWTAFLCAALASLLQFAFSQTLPAIVRIGESAMLNGVNLALLFLSIGVLFSSFNASLRRKVNYLSDTNTELERIAGTDPLTGLANRRVMYEGLERAMASLPERQFCLIIGDIDDFKGFNDRFGHACGDHVLVQCAERMRASLRSQDLVSRWGGEEFLILLPDTGLEHARAAADRVREAVSLRPIAFAEQELYVTFTLGVCQSYEGLYDVAQLIKYADEAMMLGKRQGKNRTVVA